MSAIVGPNGCGKSNIVDAVRWVVGEISAKQLRGEAMTDVIFNGTTSRKPVGKAHVELLFDNGDGRVGGEYAKFSEISVRREVVREGQSSYFINGVHVRRRDVVDLFLGTGLGPRSYSIIEQGVVSHLVEAKPEELRVFLEEASGISKYKERRRETENRMRATQENLERINDIREELNKQLNHLKRQANAAERYKIYKQKERLLNAQIKALQWKSLNEKLMEDDEEIRHKMVLMEAKNSELAHLESESEKKRKHLTDANEHYNAVQKNYYQSKAEIARLEQQLQDTREHIKQSRKEYQETETSVNELKNHIIEYQRQIKELDLEIQNTLPILTEKQAQMRSYEDNLKAKETEMQQWQEQWDQFQTDMHENDRELLLSQTKMEHYQQQIQDGQTKQNELLKQAQELKLDDLRIEIHPLAVQLESLNKQLLEIEAQILRYNQEIVNQRQSNQTLNQKIQILRQDCQNCETQCASLEALQQSALGSHQKDAQQWIRERGLTSFSRLGQKIHVKNGWELAVEIVMGSYFDAVCADTIESYISEVSNLISGCLTLIEKTTVKNTVSQSTLLNQVECDWSLAPWLSYVYCADSLEAAKKLRETLDNHESVITREGLWLGKNWIRTVQQSNEHSGFLHREQQLKQMQRKIEALKSQISDQEIQLKQNEDSLQEMEFKREDLHREYQQLSLSITKVNGEVTGKQTRLNEGIEQQQRLVQVREDSEHQIAQIRLCLHEMELKHESLRALQYQQHNQLQHLQQERDRLREQLQNCRSDALQALKETDEISNHLERMRDRLILYKTTLGRDEQQLEQIEERRNQLHAYLAQNHLPLEDLEHELQTYLHEEVNTEKQLREAEEIVTHIQKILHDYNMQKQGFQKIIQEMHSVIDEMRLERQTLTVRQVTIQEQLQESDFVLETVLDELPDESTSSVLQTDLAQLTQKIQRMGDINLAAISEYETTHERKTYLDKQFDDVSEALELLRNAIRKIDRETRTKFQETYDRVNQLFQQLFPRIFNGGAAYLEMTDEDLLSTGIVVRAQPPGKRNVTIHMLSGGEKALTAIALVFALFQLNPAPFCILDEVDAPLDDMNVMRFCHLVKEMSQEIQMLVISHNKVTIEMADHLIGVTMHEPGVSRLVSVNVQEAIQMVEA